MKSLFYSNSAPTSSSFPLSHLSYGTGNQDDAIWFEAFERFVEQNLGDTTLSIPGLADTFAMSESTLFRQIKRLTGISPKQFLCEKRLESARQLIENNRYSSISKVAYRVGYLNISSFTRAFKNHFGHPPSDFLNA